MCNRIGMDLKKKMEKRRENYHYIGFLSNCLHILDYLPTILIAAFISLKKMRKKENIHISRRSFILWSFISTIYMLWSSKKNNKRIKSFCRLFLIHYHSCFLKRKRKKRKIHIKKREKIFLVYISICQSHLCSTFRSS